MSTTLTIKRTVHFYVKRSDRHGSCSYAFQTTCSETLHECFHRFYTKKDPDEVIGFFIDGKDIKPDMMMCDVFKQFRPLERTIDVIIL